MLGKLCFQTSARSSGGSLANCGNEVVVVASDMISAIAKVCLEVRSGLEVDCLLRSCGEIATAFFVEASADCDLDPLLTDSPFEVSEVSPYLFYLSS